MSSIKTIKIDGVDINATHFAGKKESDFVAEIVPGLPERFGSDQQKKDWAKAAYAILNPSAKKS